MQVAVAVAVAEWRGKRRPTALRGAMWRRAVLWQAALLLAGALDRTHCTRTRSFPLAPQVECFDYPGWGPGGNTRSSPSGWIHGRPSNVQYDGRFFSSPLLGKRSSFSRRLDSFHSKEHIVKEHTRLVQEINGLKEELYVAPIVDKTKDYDDSIYLDDIETTTTFRPLVTSLLSKKKKTGSAIPVILIGGASQRDVVKSQLSNYMRPTVNLVGTSVSPLVKHPYPFVGHSSPTIRICMPSQPLTAPAYTKPRPNLLQRILDGFVSK